MKNKTTLVIGVTTGDDSINKLTTSLNKLKEDIDIDFIVTDNSIKAIDINGLAAEIKCIGQPNIINNITEIIVKDGEDIDTVKNFFWCCLSSKQYAFNKKRYFEDMTFGQARIKILIACRSIIPYYGNGNDLVYIEPDHWADYELETSYQVKRLFAEKTGISISLKLAYYIWSYVSDGVCASWLCHEDDNDAWNKIIGFILHGDHIREDE